jgi:hypothetical protein
MRSSGDVVLDRAERMVYISATWEYSAYDHIEARVVWSGEDCGLKVGAGLLRNGVLLDE